MSEINADADPVKSKTSARGWISILVNKLGNQTSLILLVTAFAVLMTVAAYFGGAPRDTSFWGAVFASWIAGVAFFVVAGAASAIITVLPAHKASYDARARILFRGQDGRHINYIIERVQEVLEQYAHATERRVIISEYDAAEQKFLVAMETTTSLHSYIDDMKSDVTTQVSVKGCVQSPSGRKGPRLAYVRINGEPLATNIEFFPDLDHPVRVVIPPGSIAVVESRTEYWVKAAVDPCTHSPNRYVKELKLHIDNHLAVNLPFTLSVQTGKPTTMSLRPGDSKRVVHLPDLEPNKQVFDLRLLPIEASA